MYDQELVFMLFLTLVIILVPTAVVYFLIHFLDSRYKAQMVNLRLMFATYSVPLILALIFGFDFYHSKMGYICNSAGHNTAGWTCNFGWLLIPLLMVSMALSWHWIWVYKWGKNWPIKFGRNL